MKSGSDSLFQLIGNMSKAEKRFFKLHATTYDKKRNNSLLLFIAIDRLKVYNEAELCYNIEKEHEQRFKNFSMEKQKLYGIIQKTLIQFYNNKSIESKIQSEISWARILYNKGLHKECLKTLDDAEKEAIRHAKLLLLYHIREWKRKVLPNNQLKIDLSKQQWQLLNDIKTGIQLMSVAEKLFEFSIKGQLRNPASILALDEVIAPVKKMAENTLNYISQLAYHRVFSRYFRLRGDWKNSYSHHQEIIRVLEESGVSIESRIETYISELGKFLQAAVRANIVNDFFWNKLNNLRNIPQKFSTSKLKPKTSIRAKAMSDYIELDAITSSCLFENLTSRLDEISKRTTDFFNTVDPYLSQAILLKLALIYLITQEYKSGRRVIIRLLKQNMVRAYEIEVRLLEVMIHYELKNEEFVTSRIRSLIRFLEKEEKLHQFEATLLYFFKNESSKLSDHVQEKKAFVKLRDKLRKIVEDPFESLGQEYFDMISWLNAKIDNRSFAEALKDKLDEHQRA